MSIAGRLGTYRQNSTGMTYVCIPADVGMTRRRAAPVEGTYGPRRRPRGVELVRAWRKERALKASRLGGLRVPKSLVLCEGPKSARDCGQISNANSDAPSEVHQLSVATCQSAAGRESIFGECRSRAAWAPIDKIRPV